MKNNMNMKRKVTENSGNFVPPLLRKRGPKFFPACSASGKAPALVPIKIFQPHPQLGGSLSKFHI